MAQISEFIQSYGIWVYLLLFMYCAIKSGSLPLFAGYAAQADLLALVPLIVATFAGGYLGDEFRFAVSRRYGESWATKWPRIGKALSDAQLLVSKYGWLYIFVYRYPKGMRTIGALPVGLGSMRWPTFTLLNAASAASWAILLVGMGYLFGAQIERSVEKGWGPLSLVLTVAMLLALYLAWRRLIRPQHVRGLNK
jgi:membrane-associated protein